MEKKHYIEIDSLKGWAIFLVILGHAIILFPINLHEIPWCSTMFAILSCTHMPLFFLVSGMCYSFKGDYRPYIVKKIKRLIIPYLIFASLETAVVQVTGSYVNGSSTLLEGLKSILLYGSGYWFLVALFVIFLIYPMLDKLMDANKYVGLACDVLLLVLYIAQPKMELFQIGSALKYLFWFRLGVYLRRGYSMNTLLRTDKPVWNSYLKAAVAFAMCVGLFCAFKTKTELALSIKDFFVTFAGIICSFMLVRLNWFNNVFARFGKYSLQLYLLNCFTLGASRLVACNVFDIQSAVLIIVFNMFVDYILAYIFIKYVCRRFKPVRVAMGMID